MTSENNILRQAKAIFAYLQAAKDDDHGSRIEGVLELRRMHAGSKDVIQELRRLIYSDDGSVRIYAAEALSQTASYADDAIPVLQAVLDVIRENGWTERREEWARMALGAIAHYGDAAVVAETSVWPYIYTQKNVNLQLYAIQATAKMARVSEASWTVLCLLCRHEEQEIRQFAIELMNGAEFKRHMRREYD